MNDREYFDAIRAHLVPDAEPTLKYFAYLLDADLRDYPSEIDVFCKEAHVLSNGTPQALGRGI